MARKPKQSDNSILKVLQESALLRALLLNLLFLGLSLAFCSPKYEVSDDYIMDAVLSGAYGQGLDGYILFSNILYGQFLKFLYTITTGISWYFIMQVLLGFLSLTAILYIIFKRNSLSAGLLIGIVFLGAFSDDAYILIQFTKTAALCATSGGALILFSLWEKRLSGGIRARCRRIGTFLFIMGSLIRFNCMLLVLPFLLAAFLFYAIERGSDIKRIIARVRICAMIILAAYGFRLVNTAVWSMTSGYSDYKSFSSLRSYVVDVNTGGSERDMARWAEMGKDVTDYQTIISWNFVDRNIYDDVLLEAIGEMRHAQSRDQMGDFGALAEGIDDRNYFGYQTVAAVFVLYGILMLFSPRRAGAFIPVILLAAALLMYFVSIGRILYRVEYAVILGAAVCLILQFRFDYDRFGAYMAAAAMAFVLLCHLGIYGETASQNLDEADVRTLISETVYKQGKYLPGKYGAEIYGAKPYGDLLERMKNDDDHFYLVDFQTGIQTLYFDFKPWERIEEGFFDSNNYSILGGVTMQHPAELALWRSRGIDPMSPYRSLVNDNIYVVDNRYADTKLAYLRKYYYPDAVRELVDTVSGMRIWKFRAAPPVPEEEQ